MHEKVSESYVYRKEVFVFNTTVSMFAQLGDVMLNIKVKRRCFLVCKHLLFIILGAAVAQWGKRAVLQPQGRGFDPCSPH